jgi:hypothetical protein
MVGQRLPIQGNEWSGTGESYLRTAKGCQTGLAGSGLAGSGLAGPRWRDCDREHPGFSPNEPSSVC